MIRLFSAALFLMAVNTFAIGPTGWRSVPVHGKYVREGEGWRIVGEISRMTDTETGEFVGFNFYREFRSYFIMQNHGQPMIEAWDFPLNCPDEGCPDSKLARVAFVPYLEEKMLGGLHGELDTQNGVFHISINGISVLTIDSETMTIVGGVIAEDRSRMPEMLVDPAISCTGSVTCIRSLAFGKLGYEDLRPRAVSTVSFRSGESRNVPNALVFQTRATDFANPVRFSTEKELIDAISRYRAPH